MACYLIKPPSQKGGHILNLINDNWQLTVVIMSWEKILEIFPEIPQLGQRWRMSLLRVSIITRGSWLQKTHSMNECIQSLERKKMWTIPYKTLNIIWSLRNDPLTLIRWDAGKLGIGWKQVRTDLSPVLRKQQKLRQKDKIHNF